MNLFELIEQLETIRETYGDELPVILQKDAEGNGFSPAVGATDAFYVAETTWRGQVYEESELEDYGYDEENAERVVVLWPVS